MQKLFDAFLIGPSSTASGVSLLLLALIMTADAFCRAFGIALVGATEISGVLLAALIFLSIAQVQKNKGHVAIEAVVTYMPPKLRRIAGLLALAVCLALSCLITYGTVLEAVSSYQKMEYQYGSMPFPLWPIKAVVAFGFLVLVLVQAVQVGQMILIVLGRLPPLPEVHIAERTV